MSRGPIDDRLRNLPGPSAIDPAQRVREVAETLPPRSAPERPLRTTLEGGAIYNVVRWSSADQGPGTIYNAKRYQMRGDHIYCAHLSGSSSAYLRMGPDSNPWIRLQQGQTYRRKFASFALRCSDELGFGVAVDAVLYVSEGPLVVAPEYQPGLDGGFLADDAQVATTTTQHVLGTLSSGRETIGKNGGILTIRNLDPANTLMFARWIIGAVGIGAGNPQGFPILPGESLSFDLRSKLIQRANANVIHFPVVYVRAGTCPYAFLVSGFEDDLFEVENTDPGGLST